MKLQKNQQNRRRFIPVLVLELLLIGVISCRGGASGPQEATAERDEGASKQRIAEADELYRQRDDLAKVRLGVALLRQARIADYGGYEAAWKLAKFNYYLGAHSDDEREREGAFREGIDTGKIAVQLQGDRPEGHFWLGANYGGSAEHSTLAGLASVEDIRREMETVIKIEEGYQNGSAYLGLGQLYLQAPRIMGGDYLKAIQYLEKGLKFGATNAFLRLELAEAYHAANRNGDAKKQIQFIQSLTPNPDYLPEYKEALEKAKRLEEKIDRK